MNIAEYSAIMISEMSAMGDYKEPYLHLWRGVTAAVEAMENRNYGMAEDLLKTAQQSAEEAYISQEDAVPAAPSPTESTYTDQQSQK